MGRVKVWVSESDLLIASGEQARWYLDSQLSVNAPLPDSPAKRALLLEPDGSLVSSLTLNADRDLERIEIYSPKGTKEVVSERLGRFKLRSKVDFSVGNATTVSMVSEGHEEIDRCLASVIAVFEEARVAEQIDTGNIVVSEIVLERPSSEVFDKLSDHFDLTDPDLGRILAGQPRWGRELLPGMNPTELGASFIKSRADFSKGCYTGQELIERVDSRGYNTPRKFSGFFAELQEKGATSALSPVFEIEGKPAFTITSFYASSDNAKVLGLGFTHRVGGKFATQVSNRFGTLQVVGPDELFSLF